MSQTRILVVDDNASDRARLAHILGAAGFEVVGAASGVEALAATRHRVFDAITLDLLLPDIPGASVLAQIRADTPNHDTPVVVVTVMAQPGIELSFAIQDCLMKPIDDGDVVAAVERATAQPRSGGAILVVDDNVESRRLLELTLSDAGYSVVTAADGENGLKIARERPLGAIVLDLMMPDIDGFEFLRRLRRSPHGRPTPVIVMTGKDLNGQDRRRLHGAAQSIVIKGEASTSTALLTQLAAWVAGPDTSPERELAAVEELVP